MARPKFIPRCGVLQPSSHRAELNSTPLLMCLAASSININPGSGKHPTNCRPCRWDLHETKLWNCRWQIFEPKVSEAKDKILVFCRILRSKGICLFFLQCFVACKFVLKEYDAALAVPWRFTKHVSFLELRKPPCRQYKQGFPDSCSLGSQCDFCHHEHRQKHRSQRGRHNLQKKEYQERKNQMPKKLADSIDRVYRETTEEFQVIKKLLSGLKEEKESLELETSVLAAINEIGKSAQSARPDNARLRTKSQPSENKVDIYRAEANGLAGPYTLWSGRYMMMIQRVRQKSFRISKRLCQFYWISYTLYDFNWSSGPVKTRNESLELWPLTMLGSFPQYTP